MNPHLHHRPLGLDTERDRRIAALAAQVASSADEAVRAISRGIVALLVVIGLVWAALTYLGACAAGEVALCGWLAWLAPAAPRGQPFSSTSPAALAMPATPPGPLRRLLLRLRLWHLRLQQATVRNDLAAMRENLDQDSALVDYLLDRRIAIGDEILDVELALLARRAAPPA